MRKDITVHYEHEGRSYKVIFPARGLLCVGDTATACDWTPEHDEMVR